MSSTFLYAALVLQVPNWVDLGAAAVKVLALCTEGSCQFIGNACGKRKEDSSAEKEYPYTSAAKFVHLGVLCHQYRVDNAQNGTTK